MRYETSALLRFANVIEGHSLAAVRNLPGYNTWGVEIGPNARPDTLLLGDDGRDFGMDCWPFMAAHEALHSMATFYFEGSEYHYLLYNICEDWRMNRYLLGVFGHLRQSYEAMRAVILRRWEQNPIVLTSPHSQFLQHLCYMNYTSRKVPLREVDPGYGHEVIQIREQFGHSSNWPVTDTTPEAQPYNAKLCEKLINLIRKHKTPARLNPEEMRMLIERMGYDLSFRVQNVPLTPKLTPKKEAADQTVACGDSAVVMPVPTAKAAGSKGNPEQKEPGSLE